MTMKQVGAEILLSSSFTSLFLEWDGFLLDKRQLIPTGRETWAGIKVVIDAVIKAQRMFYNNFPFY